jgi:hypothetical protein
MNKPDGQLLPIHLIEIANAEDKRKLESRIGQFAQLDKSFGDYAVVLDSITQKTEEDEKPTDSLVYLPLWGILLYEGLAIEKGLSLVGEKRLPQISGLSPQAEDDLSLLREQFDRRVSFIQEQKPYLGADDSLVPVAQIASFYTPQLPQGKFRELPQAVGETLRSVITVAEDAGRMDAQLSLMSLVRLPAEFPQDYPEIATTLRQAGSVMEKYLFECWRSLIAEFYHLDGVLNRSILSWSEIGSDNSVLISLLGTYMATRAILPPEVFTTLLTNLIGDEVNGTYVDVSEYENNYAQNQGKIKDISELFFQKQEKSTPTLPPVTRRRDLTEEEKAAAREADRIAMKNNALREHKRRIAEKSEGAKPEKPQFPISGIEDLPEELQIQIRQWIAHTDLLELVTSGTLSQRLPDGTVIHFNGIQYDSEGEAITSISFEGIALL